MDKSDKKSEILKSAEEYFAKFGFEKTTLDDIGKSVGLNKASIYYYYKNKEAIFSDVIKNETDIFFLQINNQINKFEKIEDKILFYIRQRFNYLEKTINLNKLSIEITIKNQIFFNSLLNEFFIKEVEIINSFLIESINKKEINQCDTKKTAESILIICDSIKLKVFNCYDPINATKCDFTKIENDVTFIVKLLLDGLKLKK